MTPSRTDDLSLPGDAETGEPDEAANLVDLTTTLAHNTSGHLTETGVGDILDRIVGHPEYPCLGARSVFARDRATFLVLPELGTPAAADRLLTALTDFAGRTDLDAGFASFIAVFDGPRPTTEKEFEVLLWRQLGLLHGADHEPWSPDVAQDPDDPHFAFSVAGSAYFVVGLHPGASRIARRAPWPTLVFNPHEQFEELRRSEHFVRMRDTIRQRDLSLQGTLNPMLDDHGTRSEARQYSGRDVPADWEPPVDLAKP